MNDSDNYQFEFWTEAARAALRSSSRDVVGPLTILHLAEPATPIACLVTIRKASSGLFIPLRSGRNLVRRAHVAESERLVGIVEGAQWLIRLTATGATVQDTASTNGAVLIRREDRESRPLDLIELHKDPTTCRIGWDGLMTNMEPQELRNGDILVNCYRALMYCTPDNK